MNKVKEQSVEHLQSRQYEVTCPHCETKVTVPTGESPCPACSQVIDLKLDIGFK